MRRAAVASGLIDPEWIGLQLGTDEQLSVGRAATACLEHAGGLSPHPLFEPGWLARGGASWRTQRLDPLSWYLANPSAQAERGTHPLFDPTLVQGDACEHPYGPLAGWLDEASGDTQLPVPEGLGTITWAEFRREAFASLREHLGHRAAIYAPRVVGTAPPGLRSVGGSAGADTPRTSGEPLVSVVMPTWNRARALRRAIGSVQRQTFSDWELIVIDDGSTDDTLAVLTGLAAYDDRLVVLPRTHGGVCRARNEGIARARGRYVAFLDSDNEWTAEFLAEMVATLERQRWAMAHAVIRMRDGNGTETYRAYEGTYEDLLVSNHIDLNVLVARVDAVRAVDGFDESLRRAVDYDLILKLAREHEPHLVPVIGADYDDSVGGDADDRISNTEPVTWNCVVKSKHIIDWDAASRRERVRGRVSVVVPFEGGVGGLPDWVRSTATAATAGDVELVAVGVRSSREAHVMASTIAAASEGRCRWRYLRADLPLPAAANLGLVESSGEYVVEAQDNVERDVPVLVSAARRLDDTSAALVQPVLLKPGGNILTAGAVFGPVGIRPAPFLWGHSVRDVEVGSAVEIPAVHGPVYAGRAEDLIAVRGVSALYPDLLAEVDLSLALRARGGRIVVDPDARLLYRGPRLRRRAEYITAVDLIESRWPAAPPGSAEAWRATGYDVVHHRNAYRQRSENLPDFPGPDDSPLLVPEPVLAPRRPTVREHPPALRWVIDTAAPPGEEGRVWGDTSFAESLASALEEHGQRVAVDNRALRHRITRDFDDVVLVLRGLDRVQPRPHVVNLEWIISHPDLVDAGEAAAFDHVFAASRHWSAEAAARWGLPVTPLLQCTDPARFSPERYDAESATQMLFVGKSRNVYRRAVRSAIAIGGPLTLHGNDWDAYLPEGWSAKGPVASEELGRLYASAELVLNDHWADMRRDGFVSNRLFDAAASGARIASDEVEGVDDLFGGLVRTFEDETDLKRLWVERAAEFPDRARRVEIAEIVREKHSFSARAAELVETAARLWLDQR